MNRRTALTAVAALVASATACGCGLGALAYFLQPNSGGLPPRVKLLEGRRDVKKIVCIPYADSGLRFGFDSLDNDINAMLIAEINAKEKRFDVVAERRVRAWKDQTPGWTDFSLQKIGEQFDVDYVIFYEVRRFSLNEAKNQFLLQGSAQVHLKIHDVKSDSTVIEEDYSREYPPERAVQVSDVGSEEKFKRLFLRTIARELSWFILPHEFKDTVENI